MTDFSKIEIKVANTYERDEFDDECLEGHGLNMERAYKFDDDVYAEPGHELWDEYGGSKPIGTIKDLHTGKGLDASGNRIISDRIVIIAKNSDTLPPEISKKNMKNIHKQKPDLKIIKNSEYVLFRHEEGEFVGLNKNENAYYYRPVISSYKHEDREISFIKIGKKKPPGMWDYAYEAAEEEYKDTGFWNESYTEPSEEEFLAHQNYYLVICYEKDVLGLDTCIEEEKEVLKFRDFMNFKMHTLNPGILVNNIIDVAKGKIPYTHERSYNESARETYFWEIQNTDADKDIKDGLLISYTYDPNQYDWDGVEEGIFKEFIHIPKTAFTELKDKLFDIKKKYNI